MAKQDRTFERTPQDIVRRYRNVLKQTEALETIYKDLGIIQSKIAEINAIVDDFTMDNALSETSENPVMNKTITAAINALAETIPDVIDDYTSISITDALSAAKGKDLNDRLLLLEERLLALEQGT